MVTFRLINLRMGKILGKSFRENQNTYFMFYIFFSKNRSVYEIMWERLAQPDRPQMTI